MQLQCADTYIYIEFFRKHHKINVYPRSLRYTLSLPVSWCYRLPLGAVSDLNQ